MLPYLVDSFNRSLTYGIVPNAFKTALVKPFKPSKSGREILKHYRPVSNLPFVSKVLKWLVVSRFLNYISENSLDEPLQSAYESGHSTETALVNVYFH